ncbi:hypothetical protein HYDPIDRAFT_44224 [Hydnomerulius pinastri MD-312]|uniref:Unplaced genomic scaffold scaffold_68, whole genome shotgun sequence n=1 Tax=Hydnomerulius pinastri MD-312 TaxID=994086 RepID=A0A0C9VZQ7_9AGAM|nr:hypothetical protein HYDPIDRAFT_44224 [Hydnomerulius pinastri MD-312]
MSQPINVQFHTAKKIQNVEYLIPAILLKDFIEKNSNITGEVTTGGDATFSLWVVHQHHPIRVQATLLGTQNTGSPPINWENIQEQVSVDHKIVVTLPNVTPFAGSRSFTSPVPAAPVPTAPVPADPVPAAPATTTPVTAVPVPTDLVPTDPVPTALVPPGPVPADLMPGALVPADPVPATPATAAPVTAVPGPTDLVPTDPVSTALVPPGPVPADLVPAGCHPIGPAPISVAPILASPILNRNAPNVATPIWANHPDVVNLPIDVTDDVARLLLSLNDPTLQHHLDIFKRWGGPRLSHVTFEEMTVFLRLLYVFHHNKRFPPSLPQCRALVKSFFHGLCAVCWYQYSINGKLIKDTYINSFATLVHLYPTLQDLPPHDADADANQAATGLSLTTAVQMFCHPGPM